MGTLLRDTDALGIVKTALLELREALNPALERTIAAVFQAQDHSRRKQPSPELEYARLREKRANALDAYISGRITREELTTLNQRYDTREARLKSARIPQIPAREPLLRDYLEALLSGRADSPILCRSLVESITVFPDKRLQLQLVGLEQPFSFRLEPGNDVASSEKI